MVDNGASSSTNVQQQCRVEDFSRSFHMGQDGKIIRVVSPFYVKDD